MRLTYHLVTLFSVLLLSQIISYAQAEILLDVDEEYKIGDRVLISGLVRDELYQSPVTIQITRDGNFIRADVLPHPPEGEFSLSFELKGPVWVENEIYEVRIYSNQYSIVKTFKIIPKEEASLGTPETVEENSIPEIVEDNKKDLTSSDGTETVELIKNGNFEEGLRFWKAGVFEYDQQTFPEFDEYFDCERGAPWDKCKAAGWGYPKYGLTDLNNPGERDFYANVPAFVWGWRTGVSLEQDVDIPEAQRATLSFDASGFSQTQLHIYVKDRNNGELNLINQLVVNGERWKSGNVVHREYDMTGYAGKPITLLLVASEAVIPQDVDQEEKRTTVYLDDISLSAQVLVIPLASSGVSDGFWFILVSVIGGITIVIISIMVIVIGKKKIVTTQEKSQETVSEPVISVKTVQKQPITTQTEAKGAVTLSTGSSVPKDLMPEEQKLKEIKDIAAKTATKDEPSVVQKDSAYTDDDYRFAISLSKSMMCLWTLYKEPTHSFPNRNHLLKAIAKMENREKIASRKPYYDAIKLLMKEELVGFERMPYELDYSYRETGKILLTPKGLGSIQRARKEKVTSWEKFEEKYLNEVNTNQKSTEE